MRFWKLLPDPLMWSCPIEVGHISIENPLELHLAKDQQVVKAFLAHTPQEAFADRIGSGSVRRGVENLNRARCRHTSETRPKFAIVITYEILWCLPIWRGFSQLLGDPRIGWRPCHAGVDHPSGLEFNDEEREERSKEEIRHL
jgi:hypothetical protein